MAAMLLTAGLGLFLFGMQMMSGSLEAAAQGRMEGWLRRLTGNRILGVLTGAAVTALVQSSTAITVLAVGLVDRGILSLTQAVWIILGANIGTTVTGQLCALDLGRLAPILASLGMAVNLSGRRPHMRRAGSALAGLGVMLIGMRVMETAALSLGRSRFLLGLMTRMRSPLAAMAGGALFTALIQSSSASVAILQALAVSGLVAPGSETYIVLGQNIGTCVTAILAAAPLGVSARRTALVHLLVNVLGAAAFAGIYPFIPFDRWMRALAPGNPAGRIANIHLIFNAVSTLLLLPFGRGLAGLAERLVRERTAAGARRKRLPEE